MASKDFIYDLLGKLEEEKMEYLVVFPTSTKKDVVIDIHYSLETEDSVLATSKTLERLIQKLNEDHPEAFSDDDEWKLNEELDSWEEEGE
jgi:hypothetical protein